MEATQVSINRQMDKEEMVCMYNKILLLHKKWNLLFATTGMNLEGIMVSEVSQTKRNTVCYHLYYDI